MSVAPFHVLAKPIGPICNLDCKYCFYLEKETLYPQASKWAIPPDLLESYIRQYIEQQQTNKLLNWMNVSCDPFRGYYWGHRTWRAEFAETWANAGMTRQRENDGYLPRELDYDTGLPMKNATRPK
ncbi:MAG TPA: hypothetical protein VIJ38_06685 [Acidobacteriaceae bacterium]